MIKILYLFLATISIIGVVIIKAQEEVKKVEPEKVEQVSAEQLALEKKQLLMREQEKKAIEITRNFLKFLKNKKNNDATKLLSLPFIYDEVLVFDSKEISTLLTEITNAESENLFFETPQFTLHEKQKGFTDINILINVQEMNTEENSPNILILVNRDSLKIVGVFLNLTATNQAINEKIKAKLEAKQNKIKAGASQLEE
jgi:hypothetical protein